MAATLDNNAKQQTLDQLIPQKRQNWQKFTQAIVIGCIAVALLLLAMLVFLYHPVKPH